MAKRPILILPDERLRAIAEPIVQIDDEIKQLAKDMLDELRVLDWAPRSCRKSGAGAPRCRSGWHNRAS